MNYVLIIIGYSLRSFLSIKIISISGVSKVRFSKQLEQLLIFKKKHQIKIIIKRKYKFSFYIFVNKIFNIY